MKRLVFMGEGDANAVPSLVARLLNEHPVGASTLFPDDKAFRIGNLEKFTARQQAKWVNNLRKATVRSKLGAVLVVLDGDSDFMEGAPFCPATTAITLAERARAAGAGSQFSLGERQEVAYPIEVPNMSSA